jgi:hypothetical protein
MVSDTETVFFKNVVPGTEIVFFINVVPGTGTVYRMCECVIPGRIEPDLPDSRK